MSSLARPRFLDAGEAPNVARYETQIREDHPATEHTFPHHADFLEVHRCPGAMDFRLADHPVDHHTGRLGHEPVAPIASGEDIPHFCTARSEAEIDHSRGVSALCERDGQEKT